MHYVSISIINNVTNEQFTWVCCRPLEWTGSVCDRLSHCEFVQEWTITANATKQDGLLHGLTGPPGPTGLTLFWRSSSGIGAAARDKSPGKSFGPYSSGIRWHLPLGSVCQLGATKATSITTATIWTLITIISIGFHTQYFYASELSETAKFINTIINITTLYYKINYIVL